MASRFASDIILYSAGGTATLCCEALKTSKNTFTFTTMDDVSDDQTEDFTEGLDEYGPEIPYEDIVAAFAARIGPEIDEIAHNVRLLINAASSEIWERGSEAGKRPDMGDLLSLHEEVESVKKLNAKLRRATQMVKNEGFGTDLRQVMRAQDQRTAELNTREEVCVETEIALDKKDEALKREKEQNWEDFRSEQRDWNDAVEEEWEKLK